MKEAQKMKGREIVKSLVIKDQIRPLSFIEEEPRDFGFKN
jgi:hypothetical protein